MNFTFGIITNSKVDERIIESICNQKIDDFEIIICGGNHDYKDHKHIPFDETEKKAWITKKKNLITENAQYENIVYMHDYIKLEDGWYEGYKKFGNNFYVCMNKILTVDNKRFRDWCVFPNFVKDEMSDIFKNQRQCLISYDINLSKFGIMYFSGAYWVAKKRIMEEFPLNESLVWGQGEDVEWSRRITKKYEFSMNIYSKVKLLKQKHIAFNICSEENAEKIKKYYRGI